MNGAFSICTLESILNIFYSYICYFSFAYFYFLNTSNMYNSLIILCLWNNHFIPFAYLFVFVALFSILKWWRAYELCTLIECCRSTICYFQAWKITCKRLYTICYLCFSQLLQQVIVYMMDNAFTWVPEWGWNWHEPYANPRWIYSMNGK